WVSADDGELEPRSLDVLVVEDDVDTGRMLSLQLRRRGHRTIVCAELEAATTLLNVRCFDLALVDLSLYDGTGLEAARVARSRVPRPYLVAVTGWAAGELRAEAEDLFDEVVTKPLDPVRLDEVLESALAQA